jgi:hypothetical protein
VQVDREIEVVHVDRAILVHVASLAFDRRENR